MFCPAGHFRSDSAVVNSFVYNAVFTILTILYPLFDFFLLVLDSSNLIIGESSLLFLVVSPSAHVLLLIAQLYGGR